jgi:Domain of unknown function (DUF4783)
MKKLFVILGFLFSIATFAQTGDNVVNALKEGNTSKFTSYFSSSVDIKLPQKDEMKSANKADASSTVSNFFSSNKINGFEVTSQREMGGTMYITGKLKGASQDYNLTVMLKGSGNDMLVITVRIS